jgi:ABC-type phosphate transport system substrate-binding protein
MTVRKYCAGLAASGLIASGFALAVVAPASADPTFTPDANDIVGVGSDTIEFVVGDLAAGKTIDGVHVNGWNDTHTGVSDQRLASFNATGTSPVVLREGSVAVTRPNGSGSGKATLFGAGDNPDVNFARSSSSLNASNGEATALTQFPFAVDGLKMAVSGSTPSNAPASLTISDIVKIYDGTYKKWSDIDPSYSADFIQPKTPQSGSGTRSFFDSELKAANGGVAVVYATPSTGYLGVQEVQEHDPTPLQGNPDAIGPFSTARAQTLANPAVIKFEGGYSAKRAVYDVVRNADAGAAWTLALFGPSGFFCSPAAKPIIEANGFAQLADDAHGGVCGAGVTTAVSNFTTNTVTTTTTLAAAAPVGRQAHLTATVATGGDLPDGDVNFYEGATKVATGLLTAGTATVNVTGVTPGVHTYVAKFVSANPAAFTDSDSTDASVTVKEVSTTTTSVIARSYGHPSTATVAVSTAGNPAVGDVTVKVGTWQATKALTAGAASFTIPGTLPAGAKSLLATYGGDATTATSQAAKAFTIAKSAVVVSETFPAKVLRGKRGIGYVKVALSPSSTVKPTGRIVIKRGTKIVGKGTLVNGVVRIKLAALPRGTNTLVATYSGSANTLTKRLRFLVVQK